MGSAVAVKANHCCQFTLLIQSVHLAPNTFKKYLGDVEDLAVLKHQGFIENPLSRALSTGNPPFVAQYLPKPVHRYRTSS
jgi:hypothetical protein